jgi:hypothetical protein
LVRARATNDTNTKLEACMGDCDSDDQCETGLRCFRRRNGESVPGCYGAKSAADWGYCYVPGAEDIELSGTNNESPTNLAACTGECDSDDQCAAGLKCFQRTYGETIPGCYGAGGGPQWDYCYDPGTPATA